MEHVIYSNFDILSEENMDRVKEELVESAFSDTVENTIEMYDNFGYIVKADREHYAKSLKEKDIIDACYDDADNWLFDEMSNLEELDCDRDLIAIYAYSKNNTIHVSAKTVVYHDIFYTNFDLYKIYVNKDNDLARYESDHDGSRAVIFRFIRNDITDEAKEEFEDSLYDGTATMEMLDAFTEKLGDYVRDIYGWED